MKMEIKERKVFFSQLLPLQFVYVHLSKKKCNENLQVPFHSPLGENLTHQQFLDWFRLRMDLRYLILLYSEIGNYTLTILSRYYTSIICNFIKQYKFMTLIPHRNTRSSTHTYFKSNSYSNLLNSSQSTNKCMDILIIIKQSKSLFINLL